MSIKNDLQQISDSHNSALANFQEKVDKEFAKVIKDMYQSANNGNYCIRVKINDSNNKIYQSVFNNLKAEGVKIHTKKAITKTKDGEVEISWHSNIR